VVDQPDGTESVRATRMTKGPRVREDPETRKDSTGMCGSSQTDPTTVIH